WQGKKPYLLWFSMFLTDQPLRALNRLSQKKLDHRVLMFFTLTEVLAKNKGGTDKAFRFSCQKKHKNQR
ncbi:MAG TPA: hypothetical protein VJ936_01550, partial [Desulfobacteraceae bacterium]|nr:hypothetical protein [Desulfobacteraceae bacterium]